MRVRAIQITKQESEGRKILLLEVFLGTRIERLGHLDLSTGRIVPGPDFSEVGIETVLAVNGTGVEDILRRMQIADD